MIDHQPRRKEIKQIRYNSIYSKRRQVQCVSVMSHAHLREEGTPMFYPGWVRPYSVHHSLVRHSPAFIVEALERVDMADDVYLSLYSGQNQSHS